MGRDGFEEEIRNERRKREEKEKKKRRNKPGLTE
jgi:hypothetical protein